MAALAHATLQRLVYTQRPSKTAPAKVKPDGVAWEVQFNPASLKITRRNNVDRNGLTTGTQKREHPAQEASSLSFTLEFDTAEQGQTTARVDVREWTALIRQFVEPPKDRPSGPPPAVRFAWGKLIFNGIIDEVTEDLDLFAPDGTPLHAKVAVAIRELNLADEAVAAGAGALDDKGATLPGEVGGSGSAGTDAPAATPQQVEPAQQGESVQQLMGRLGLAPAQWRAAMTGLQSPLALPAGTPVQLPPAAFTAPAGESVAGFAADAAPGSPEVLASALGLSSSGAAGPAPGGPAPDARTAGLILAAGGGIAASARTVAAARAEAAVAQARMGFAGPAPAPAADARAPAANAPPPATVDPRAATYGSGIPLRRRGNAQTLADIQADTQRPGDIARTTLGGGRGCCGDCAHR
ncbi:hypothetical protein Q2K19_22145 [Micromonospora soli]|uniref:CIS tube protein n=1 Tax=Micromonospora sp. NBRC 110009 TaxID=3061627 RepID=UPI0026741EA1|nr:hypothetical protein [Micromonospora sp. NBRC 110009]WKT96878.1 hypothetical protein Q2K19_22145 [Micromonospora sp. NBRC 110009]